MISLRNVVDQPKALFLVDQVTWEEQDDGAIIAMVTIVRLDASGCMVAARNAA
ncbi:MAG: hypothetical protein QM775_10330 [Pirellulales bacterium]